MADDQEIQNGENLVEDEIRVPLISLEKRFNNGDEEQPKKGSIGEERSMVYLTTFVAVCGSYAFGSCVCKEFSDNLII